MSGTEKAAIVVDDDLPLIANVTAREKFQVEIEWRHGLRAVVDLAPDRDNRHLFESAIVSDHGDAIAWGGGEIDMPATAVERLAGERMSAENLREFMRVARLTRDGLAAQLGVSRRLVGYWLEGQTIPRYTLLACRALAAEVCGV